MPTERLLGLAMLWLILCGFPSQMSAAESNGPDKPPTPGGRDAAPRLSVELDGVSVVVTSDGKHALLTGDNLTRTPRVSKETIELLYGHTSLEWLRVEMVVFSADSLKLLKRLPNLKSVQFVRTSAGDEAIASLAELKTLTAISIADCLITDRSISLFGRIATLKELSLQRNRFMPLTAHRNLRKLLPSDVKLQFYR